MTEVPTVVDYVRSIWDNDDDEIFAGLGGVLLGSGLGMMSSSDGGYMQFARKWFDRKQDDLRAIVCADETRSRIEAQGDNDPVVVAAAIADLLASTYDLPAAATLAVIIVRFGLHSFCEV